MFYVGFLSAHGRSSVVHEPVESGCWTGVSILMSWGQPGITKGNVIHSHIQGDFISLADAGESGQDIW